MDTDTLDYFVVMAKADQSLQELLNKGPILEGDAAKILTDIALGLYEVKEIVHRDLKPGNVLYHDDLFFMYIDKYAIISESYLRRETAWKRIKKHQEGYSPQNRSSRS